MLSSSSKPIFQENVNVSLIKQHHVNKGRKLVIQFQFSNPTNFPRHHHNHLGSENVLPTVLTATFFRGPTSSLLTTMPSSRRKKLIKLLMASDARASRACTGL